MTSKMGYFEEIISMELIGVLLSTFLISYLSIRAIKPLANKFGLVDQPNERKQHEGAIPLIGGIAIFIGVITSMMIFLPDKQILNFYFISSAIILLLGVLDDKHDLKVSYRMAVQAFSACIMIFGASMCLESLGNIFGFFEVDLGYLGVLITIVAVIAAINAFNMVDGIDGLAGMLSISTFLGLTILFFQAGDSAWIIPAIFIAAICAYLTFNLGWPIRKAKKIFMGDAGSMLIGLTVVWLLVYGSQGEQASFKPVTALWIIALPLMDMAAIMIRRVRKGQSPFKPDRDHLHHICMRAGLTARQSLGAITMFSMTMIIFGVIADVLDFPEWSMFATFIILFGLYSYSIQNIFKITRFVRGVRS